LSPRLALPGSTACGPRRCPCRGPLLDCRPTHYRRLTRPDARTAPYTASAAPQPTAVVPNGPTARSLCWSVSPRPDASPSRVGEPSRVCSLVGLVPGVASGRTPRIGGRPPRRPGDRASASVTGPFFRSSPSLIGAHSCGLTWDYPRRPTRRMLAFGTRRHSRLCSASVADGARAILGLSLGEPLVDQLLDQRFAREASHV